jgi:hypothetical protein
MWYFGGALPDPPLLEDPGMVLFLFFSSTSPHAFIILSWSGGTSQVIVVQVGGLD